MQQPDLHLASSSARRREILTTLGVSFSYAGVDIDESRVSGESVADMVLRLAREKAQAAVVGDLPVLGADTIVTRMSEFLASPPRGTTLSQCCRHCRDGATRF